MSTIKTKTSKSKKCKLSRCEIYRTTSLGVSYIQALKSMIDDNSITLESATELLDLFDTTFTETINEICSKIPPKENAAYLEVTFSTINQSINIV